MIDAQITLGPMCGAGSRVLLDGHDITNGVHGLRLSASVGNPPMLYLEIPLHHVDVDTRDVQVRIGQHTHDALVALGWTPPA